MSQTDQESFWALVEDVVDMANTRAEDLDTGIINAALAEASARFAAYYVASHCESRNDLKEDKNDAIERVSRDFKRRFAENLEDYIENYKIYMRDE